MYHTETGDHTETGEECTTDDQAEAFCKDDHPMMLKLQVANIFGFVLSQLAGAFADKLARKTQREISEEWNIHFFPGAPTFIIWPFIYAMITFFVVWQALPPHWAQSRNNTLIYKKIG